MSEFMTNPKTGEELKIIISFKIAVEKCKALSHNNFAQSLVKTVESGRMLTQAQEFWLFKIAQENLQGRQAIKLSTDLESFCRQGDRLMFKINEHTRVKFYTKEYHIAVFYSGGDQTRFAGEIKKDEFEFHPKCPNDVKAMVMLFGKDPKNVLTHYGKEWGICCVCGRELENEESVRAGIGPICAGKYGFG